MTRKIEFRIKEVTRYIVTKYEQFDGEDGGHFCESSSPYGEYSNERQAKEIADALLSHQMSIHKNWKHVGPRELEIYSNTFSDKDKHNGL